MQREDILSEIAPLCQSVFARPDLEIKEELDATMIDTWTSLSFMHLLHEVENHFGFKFKLFELLGIRCIGDLVSVIALHL
jgi:acyl carrier protein